MISNAKNIVKHKQLFKHNQNLCIFEIKGGECMKKYIQSIIIIFLLITNAMFIKTTIAYKSRTKEQPLKVYSIKGENSAMKISNGFIIISQDRQIINGGDIEYIGGNIESIQSYSKTIYIDKQGTKEPILLNSVSSEGNYIKNSLHKELLMNNGIGEISSKSLFSNDDITLIKDNLYFSLQYLTTNGDKGEFTIKLNVNEFNTNTKE